MATSANAPVGGTSRSHYVPFRMFRGTVVTSLREDIPGPPSIYEVELTDVEVPIVVSTGTRVFRSTALIRRSVLQYAL